MGQSPVAQRSKSATRRVTPDNVATMNFPQAMQAIIDGGRVTKLEWLGDGKTDPKLATDYCELRGTMLMIYRHDKWHQWLISDGDIMGQDWVVI